MFLNAVYRVSRLCLLSLILLSPLTVKAAELVEGTDYQVIQPAQPTDSPGKIEVLEFFSYACPHCAEFNPLLAKWSEKLPAGVVFKRVPVTFGRASWGNLARLYFALETIGELQRLDNAAFDAIHKQRQNLSDLRTLNEWLVRQKVDVEKFNEAFNAFSVKARLSRGDQMSRDYAIDGVPTLAINGQYLALGKNHEDSLRVADALIAKVRADMKPAAKASKK